MAYSFIVSTSKGVADGSLGPTSAIDTTGANLIVIGIHHSTLVGFSPDTVSDNKSNTWTPIDQSQSVNNASASLFYALNPTVGAGHTFNDSAGIGVSHGAVITVLAFAGAPASAVVDVSVKNQSSAFGVGTLQTGAIVPATSDQLFVTAICIGAHTLGGYGSTDIATVDTGFTKQEQVTSVGTWLDTAPYPYMNGAIAYKIQSGSHAENPTWTWSPTDTIASVIMATFKPSSGTSSAPQPPFGGAIGPYAWMEWPRRVP